MAGTGANFVCLGCVAGDSLRDDLVRHAVQVFPQGMIEFDELRPKSVGYEGTRDAHHDGIEALAPKPTRAKAVATKESYEQLARPSILEGEAVLDGRIGVLVSLEFRRDSLAGIIRGDALAVGRGTRAERFDLAQLFKKAITPIHPTIPGPPTTRAWLGVTVNPCNRTCPSVAS